MSLLSPGDVEIFGEENVSHIDNSRKHFTRFFDGNPHPINAIMVYK